MTRGGGQFTVAVSEITLCCLNTFHSTNNTAPAERARLIRESLPEEGLFAGHAWRVSPDPFALGTDLAHEIESLGRVLLQFYRASNLLYRKSFEGKQPEWVARWLDQGKPAELIAVQRSSAFKNELPRVIRPDLLLTGHGLSVTELDSVPGGIGLTAWLNQVYSRFWPTPIPAAPTAGGGGASPHPDAQSAQITKAPSFPSHAGKTSELVPGQLLGGPDGMLQGFASIFGDAPRVQIIVSEEAATYRPEMKWVAGQLGSTRFQVRDSNFTGFSEGDAVYRFFELFDLANVGCAQLLFEMAASRRLRVTPPPKPLFEEKMLFALLWNRHLHSFWRQELGESFLRRLQQLVPYTWLVDPAPLPPHAAIPELNLTDWRQLQALSQKERELILKVSGFSPHAWGARGVYLGSDLPHAEWTAAVERALSSFDHTPFVLQRYHKPGLVEAHWFDFARNETVLMQGRARICPYYFVSGDGDAARARLGGALATICPSDKKIIHGMTDAVFAPCSV